MTISSRTWKSISTAIIAVSVVLFLARWPISGKLWNVTYLGFAGTFFGGPKQDVSLLLPLAGRCFALVCIVLSVIAMRYRLGEKRWYWTLAACISILPALGFHGVSWPDELEPPLVERGHRIVQAIEHYKADNGNYPANLDDLVPNYISRNQELKFGDLQYYYGRKDKAEKWLLHYMGDNPYVVLVSLCPAGTLVYRPNRNYVDMKGKPIGHGWASTHWD